MCERCLADHRGMLLQKLIDIVNILVKICDVIIESQKYVWRLFQCNGPLEKFANSTAYAQEGKNARRNRKSIPHWPWGANAARNLLLTLSEYDNALSSKLKFPIDHLERINYYLLHKAYESFAGKTENFVYLPTKKGRCFNDLFGSTY